MPRPESDESDTPRDESGALTIQLGRIGQKQGRIRRESRSSARALTGRENTKGSRPVMATCSPRVGITLLAGWR